MQDELHKEALSQEEAQTIADAIPPPPVNPTDEGEFDLSPMLSRSVERVSGDVTVDELHLKKECSSLVIDGSLTVRGILKEDFRAGGLLVLGDLQAGHVVTTAAIACTGNLTVAGVLYGNCTNYATDVWGVTTAKLLISAKEHLFSMWGGQHIDCIIDVYGDTPNLAARHYDESSMHEVLFSEVADAFDEDRVFETLKQHGTLLRGQES